MLVSIQITNTYDVEMPEEAADLLQRVIDQNLEMKERIEHLETKLKEVKSDRKAAMEALQPFVEMSCYFDNEDYDKVILNYEDTPLRVGDFMRALNVTLK
jgi:hypothetical protein